MGIADGRSPICKESCKAIDNWQSAIDNAAMSIGFVVGRAGTGKTRHCLSRIKQLLKEDPLGPPIFWIVPRQATFSAERMLLAEHGPFCRCRILSFDRLGGEVLNNTSGAANTAISARGRQMILGLLLRKLQGKLNFFSSSARRVGLARELDLTFAEFERSGTTPAEMVATLQQAINDNPGDADTETLLAKSQDLLAIYTAYNTYLGNRLDPYRRLELVLDSIAACSTFQKSIVFIDSFTEFTLHERQMICGLAGVCREVTVTLAIDPQSPVLSHFHKIPGELSLFHRIERCYSNLMVALSEAGVAIRPIAVLDKTHRFASPALAAIERHGLDRTAAPQGPVDSGLERIVAPDRASEVDAVARRIRDLQASGVRLRDIVLLVRDLSNYQSQISTSFKEHGIPLFIDARRSAVHHPLVQWLRAVLAIALNRWPHDDVIALLKTGLAGVPLAAADEIENYALEHGLTRDAWESAEPWKYAASTAEADDGEQPATVETAEPSRINEYRWELHAKFKPFLDVVRHQRGLTFRQICSALFGLFDAFQLRQTLAGWIEKARADQQLELAAEHEQTWANLVELFDELVDLLGDQNVTLDDFIQTLEAGQERFDFALAPPTLDQVEVGTIDRSRALDAKITFVLGLAEGMFPKVESEPTVISDTERGLLRRRSIELDDDTSRKLLDERLLGYLAFTRASQKLILSRPTSDDSGKPLNPSPFWLRVESLFSNADHATITAPRQVDTTPTSISTPRQLVTGLMRWVRESAASGQTPDPKWAALYNALADNGRTSEAIRTLRQTAWPALGYVNEARLSSGVAGKLFHSPLHASVSRIETFSACKFKHFAQYGLGLGSRRKHSFSRGEMGQAYHRILDVLVTDLLQRKLQWKDLSDGQAADTIRNVATQIMEEMNREVQLSTPRVQYLFRRIQRTVSQVVASQRSLANRQTLRLQSTGVRFGSSKDKLLSPTIETPGKRQVILHGKIDRLDRMPDSLDFAVVDYKSGDATLKFAEVYHGLAIQLLTYMLVLRENRVGQKPCTPIGAFYYRVTRSLKSKRPSEAPEPGSDEFLLDVKPRGIFNGDYVRHFDQQLETGSSLALNVSINKDKSFGRRESSDVADATEIDLLLDYVRDKIGQLTDGLMSGEISVEPYRLGKVTPCPRCEFRSVCRFEMGINHYHQLQSMGRSEVFEQIAHPDGGKDV